MQFLDAIGLAYFWEKIKNWANSCFFSNRGGEISPKSGLHYIINGEQLGISKSGNENETIDIFNVDENGMEAISIKKSGGTATQVLMADGSVRTLNTSNGIAGLDANGNVPLANLGNLDTTVAEVVTELPTSNIKRHIYLVKDSDTTNNKYAEYVYTGDISAAYDSTKWEKLGDFRATVDLADYAKTADVNAALAKKVDVVSGKGLSTNDFTAAYKSKLDGIAANANNYSLPLAANGTRGGIQVGYAANGRNYPVQLDGEKAYVNVPWIDTTYDLTPYAKKNEVVGVNEIELVKIPQGSSTKQVITFSNINRGDGTSVTFETATTSMDGFISASDKNKLDGISSGATADSAIPTSVIDALN